MSEPCQHSVLIIDDEKYVAELIADIAIEFGMAISISLHFDDVLPAIDKFPPTIIFLDMNLGDHSGTEVLDMLANTSNEAKIILMSGMDSTALETARQKAEVLGLNLEPPLSKPFQLEDVEACLQRALEND